MFGRNYFGSNLTLHAVSKIISLKNYVYDDNVATTCDKALCWSRSLCAAIVNTVLYVLLKLIGEV